LISASTGAFDQGGDTYQEGTRQVDEQRRGVLPTLPYLWHPVCPETEWQTAIRQIVPTKAPVEAETSTIINKRLFFLKNIILNSLSFNLWVYLKINECMLTFIYFNNC